MNIAPVVRVITAFQASPRTVRDIAAEVGINDQAARRIVKCLLTAGFVEFDGFDGKDKPGIVPARYKWKNNAQAHR